MVILTITAYMKTQPETATPLDVISGSVPVGGAEMVTF